MRNLDAGGQSAPADGEQRDASLRPPHLSGVLLGVSSPLQVILPVVCLPSSCGGPGMVLCSALCYPWSLTSTQVHGEDLSAASP